jgi:choline-sulfatase
MIATLRPWCFGLWTLSAVLALCVDGQRCIAREPVAKPPNVLVICADDHAAYVTGVYGNAQVRTPNIDRLAAGGIHFLRAYCNSPVCTASRQSLLTGRYPRTIGVTELKTALPESEVTMAETLKLAGFDTASIGKMHFNSNLSHGFDLRVDLPEYQRWLRSQQKMPTPEGVLVQPPWRPFKDPARVWLNAECRPVDTADAQMDASYFATEAAEYITAKREKPYFLMVSFYEPHSPYRFPLEFRGRHDPAKFAVPSVGSEDDDQIPAVFRDLTDTEKQGIQAAYYTSVEFMDQNVGVVLDALERSGQADDTIVVYLGDHGYLLGQHGRFEKHCSYEEAIRVPLAIRYPKRIAAGRLTHAFVELVDLVPTIYNLCEYNGTAPLQGKSLIQLLDGKTTKHRDHVIVEYAQNDEVMVRDDYWKLVYERNARRRTDGYDTERPLQPNQFRLYDLHGDPQELHNVVADPQNAETVARLTTLLVDHLVKTAREISAVPTGADALTILDYCVQPRDVGPGK